MDFDNLLSREINVNVYVSVTNDLAISENKDNIQCDVTTVNILKRMQSVEIEYFYKYNENGAAFIIFKEILHSKPTEFAWRSVREKLVSLIQYWLVAVRKHLLSHHIYWWTFLKVLLNFIREILKQDSSVRDIIVQQLSESLLDLATREQMSVHQRYEILHALNVACADSSRDVRTALRPAFEAYLVRLSSKLVSCGHLPVQYCIVETLMRWLIPRSAPDRRREAAAKWFPEHLYSRAELVVFLERPWRNFTKDARDFLNTHNAARDQITSVVCRRLSVGDHVLITGAEGQTHWLDINLSTRCLTVVMSADMLATLGVQRSKSFETLAISNDIVLDAKLYREGIEVTISLRTSESPKLDPCSLDAFGDGGKEVKIVISARCDMVRVDNALRLVFRDKYQVLLDVDNMLPLSARDNSSTSKISSDDSTRFSRAPQEVRRHTHAGYIMVKPCIPVSFNSPSTASTSSLAQLHEKLAALPRTGRLDKRNPISSKPVLSDVVELPETSGLTSTTSTFKLGPCGIITRSLRPRKTQSDTEVTKIKTENSINDTDKKKTVSLYKVVKDHLNNQQKPLSCGATPKNTSALDDQNSCLFVAGLGSTDESVINDTLERLSKHKDYSPSKVVDLLLQDKYKLNNNIDTEDLANKNENSKPNKATCMVLSKSTSNESNTEAINDTPLNYVTVRNENLRRKVNKDSATRYDNDPSEIITFDENVVEQFFSQHCAQNKTGDLLISPTLAKKINETSSESSDNLDCYLISNANINLNIGLELPDIDIVDCLNSIIDKVCLDLDKCTGYLNSEVDGQEMKDLNENVSAQANPTNRPFTRGAAKQNKNIKLKFTTERKKAPKQKKLANSKLQLKPASEITTVENNVEIIPEKIASPKKTKPESVEGFNLDTPLTRRKRKLYSPKTDLPDVSNNNEINTNKVVNSDDKGDVPLSVTKKSKVTSKAKTVATCYTDIEEDRQKHRVLRKRKSKSNPDVVLSPKTLKNNMIFDHLKDSGVEINSADKQISDKDIAIFNFTSDSEDEDFKRKKIEMQSRTSTTTVDSGQSTMRTRRRGRNKANNSETESINKKPAKKTAVRKKTAKRQPKSKTKVIMESVENLEDERMRKAVPEELDVSLEQAKSCSNTINEEPDPAIVAPEVQLMTDDETPETVTKKKRVNKIKPVKKVKDDRQKKLEVTEDIEEDNRTTSPLPGLVVETVHIEKKKLDESVTDMMKNLKKLYNEDGEVTIETNTTHNLLSDYDKSNIYQQFNVTEKLNIDDPGTEVANNKEDDRVLISKGNDTHFEEIEFNLESDVGQNNDIGHGDLAKEASSKPAFKKMNLKLKSSKDVKKSKENNLVLDQIRFDTRDSQTEEKIRLQNELNKTETTQGQVITNFVLNKRNKSKSKSPDTTKFSNDTPIKFKVANSANDIATVYISDASEEISVNSEGITGHGDLNQTPPGYNSLTQSVVPREIEDMDESLKRHFLTLRGVNTPTESNSSASNYDNAVKNSETGKSKRSLSPVIYLERLSPEVISKWTRSPVINEELTRNSDDDNIKWLPSRTNSNYQSDDGSSKHDDNIPLLNFPKLRSAKRKLWPNNSVSSESVKEKGSSINEPSKLSKPTNSPKACVSLISPIKMFKDSLPKLRPRRAYNYKFIRKVSDKYNAVCESSPSSKLSTIEDTRFTNPDPKKDSRKLARKPKERTAPLKYYQKVLRSPVRSSSPIKDSRTLVKSPIEAIALKDFESVLTSPVRSSSPMEDSSNLVRSPIETTPKDCESVENPLKTNALSEEVVRNDRNNPIRSLENPEAPEKFVLSRENTDSTEYGNMVASRPSEVNVYASINKLPLPEWTPTNASIFDWFTKYQSSIGAGIKLDIHIDTVINDVMERLDTTIKETHSDTNQKFACLFVDIQKLLREVKQASRVEAEAVITKSNDMLRTMVEQNNQMLQTMTEMNTKILQEHVKRTEERETKLSNLFKETAEDFLGKERKKKAIMMELLHEDVTAVKDYRRRLEHASTNKPTGTV